MNKEVNKTDINQSKPARSLAANKTAQARILESVNLTVEAFLGQAHLTVGALKNLDVDEVIELDAPLNRSVELRLNGVAVATGELVVAGEKFGVKVTAISET